MDNGSKRIIYSPLSSFIFLNYFSLMWADEHDGLLVSPLIQMQFINPHQMKRDETLQMYFRKKRK